MRVVGLDVSRTVAEIAYLEDGQVKAGGRVELVQGVLTRWAAMQLRASDHMVLEATGNTTAVVNAVRAHVARVVVANPFQVRLIAEARVKTDKIDAAVLAQLYASGFSPKSGFQTTRRKHSDAKWHVAPKRISPRSLDSRRRDANTPTPSGTSRPNRAPARSFEE